MILFSQAVTSKLAEKHGVTEKEVVECFANGEGVYLIDSHEDHQTDPPTLWFMAPTNHNRLLKVCFVDDVAIKTAFGPSNKKHLELYRQMANLPSCWPDEE